MADFVGDDIGFGEPAGARVRAGAELTLHVLEESGIEINALIARAIKRAHGRARESAWRRFGAGEQAQFGRMIGPAARGKDLAPAVLGVAEDERNKFPGRIVRGAGVNRRSLA